MAYAMKINLIYHTFIFLLWLYFLIIKLCIKSFEYMVSTTSYCSCTPASMSPNIYT